MNTGNFFKLPGNHLIPTSIDIIKTLENNKRWQGYGEMRTLYIAGGNAKWSSCCAKQYGTS